MLSTNMLARYLYRRGIELSAQKLVKACVALHNVNSLVSSQRACWRPLFRRCLNYSSGCRTCPVIIVNAFLQSEVWTYWRKTNINVCTPCSCRPTHSMCLYYSILMDSEEHPSIWYMAGYCEEACHILQKSAWNPQGICLSNPCESILSVSLPNCLYIILSLTNCFYFPFKPS